MAAKTENIKYMDEDFLGNKINIGDIVIFEAPKYRDFTIGKVITKAEKTCQIEYVNNWNYPEGKKQIVRQFYCQVIKKPSDDAVEVVRCKECKHSSFVSSCSKYECKKGCGALKYSNDFCSYGERKEN